jgi:hypothetical protein
MPLRESRRGNSYENPGLYETHMSSAHGSLFVDPCDPCLWTSYLLSEEKARYVTTMTLVKALLASINRAPQRTNVTAQASSRAENNYVGFIEVFFQPRR